MQAFLALWMQIAREKYIHLYQSLAYSCKKHGMSPELIPANSIYSRIQACVISCGKVNWREKLRLQR